MSCLGGEAGHRVHAGKMKLPRPVTARWSVRFIPGKENSKAHRPGGQRQEGI